MKKGIWTITTKREGGSTMHQYSDEQPVMQDGILEFVNHIGNYKERIDCTKYHVKVSFEPYQEKV